MFLGNNIQKIKLIRVSMILLNNPGKMLGNCSVLLLLRLDTTTIEVGQNQELNLDIQLHTRNKLLEGKMLALEEVVEGVVQSLAAVRGLLLTLNCFLMVVPQLRGKSCRTVPDAKRLTMDVGRHKICQELIDGFLIWELLRHLLKDCLNIVQRRRQESS